MASKKKKDFTFEVQEIHTYVHTITISSTSKKKAKESLEWELEICTLQTRGLLPKSINTICKEAKPRILQTVNYHIINPDGKPISTQPFSCSWKEFLQHSHDQFEIFKNRYSDQGHYPSTFGPIPLSELRRHCEIREIADF